MSQPTNETPPTSSSIKTPNSRVAADKLTDRKDARMAELDMAYKTETEQLDQVRAAASLRYGGTHAGRKG